MARMGMVIDLRKCTSCGACALGCKTENNTRTSIKGSTFNWADFITYTQGEFPNSKFISIPVLCNHCTNAPCVAACPVTPKAMFKTANGLTMHNDERCIGCRLCMDACPYSSKDTSTDGSFYSVISFNPKNEPTHPFYTQTTAVIPGGTSSPAEVVAAAGSMPPNMNEYTHPDYNAVRPAGVTEKCTLCEHRTLNGESPYCVNCCPAGARVVGDFDDPNSEVSQLIKQHSYFRLKNNKGYILQPGEQGTDPNVYYIRNFETTTSVEEDDVLEQPADFARLYPNPATGFTRLEIETDTSGYLDCTMFNVEGRLVASPWQHEFVMPGTQVFDISLIGLAPGTYIVQVVLGGKINTKKLIVQ